MRADLIRNDLTTEWKERGASEGTQFAILSFLIRSDSNVPPRMIEVSIPNGTLARL
jgi:hypothetical protein